MLKKFVPTGGFDKKQVRIMSLQNSIKHNGNYEITRQKDIQRLYPANSGNKKSVYNFTVTYGPNK